MVAYRLIRILWGERLCYIIIKAEGKVEGKVVLVCVQQAIGDVSHWGWVGGHRVGSVSEIDGDSGPGDVVRVRTRRRFKAPACAGWLIGPRRS